MATCDRVGCCARLARGRVLEQPSLPLFVGYGWPTTDTRLSGWASTAPGQRAALPSRGRTFGMKDLALPYPTELAFCRRRPARRPSSSLASSSEARPRLSSSTRSGWQPSTFALAPSSLLARGLLRESEPPPPARGRSSERQGSPRAVCACPRSPAAVLSTAGRSWQAHPLSTLASLAISPRPAKVQVADPLLICPSLSRAPPGRLDAVVVVVVVRSSAFPRPSDARPTRPSSSLPTTRLSFSMSPAKRSLLIVGSGIFGTSTAISFLKEGGWDVRIIDKVRRRRRRLGPRSPRSCA